MNKTEQTKLIEQTIKQNLLLWELTESFMEIEKKLSKALGED